MRLETPIVRYRKGMLLEADMLNRDFSLARFLLERCAAGRLSDGVIDGLAINPKGGGIVLGSGAFKLGGVLGWIGGDIALELPPKNEWRFLSLESAGENVWNLEWKAAPTAGDLVVCRLKLLDPDNLRESPCFDKNPSLSLSAWIKYLQGVDYIQSEYAMAASFSARPTLLPSIQRFLAGFAKSPDLKIHLLNGAFPMLDFYDTDDWQMGIDALTAKLTDAPLATPRREDNSII